VSDADVKALRAKYVTACALEPWGEAAAVVSLLKMLAVRDPRQAEVVYESMMAVLDGRLGG